MRTINLDYPVSANLNPTPRTRVEFTSPQKLNVQTTINSPRSMLVLTLSALREWVQMGICLENWHAEPRVPEGTCTRPAAPLWPQVTLPPES